MTIPQRIFWTTFGTAAVAIVTVIALLMWTAVQTNQIAQAQTKSLVSNKLNDMVTTNALLTMDYAFWTSSYEWYRDRDEDALYENLGSGAADSESFDLIYFLAPDGTVTHAYGPGVYRSELDFIAPQIVAPVLPMIARLSLLPYDTAETLVNVDGDIAVVAAGRIQPDDTDGLTVDDLAIMVGVRWLDTTTFGQTLLLEGLQLSDGIQAESADLDLLVLTNRDQTPIGSLVWNKPNPGRILLKRTLPIAAALACLLVLGSWIAGRTSARQATDYVRERMAARTDGLTGVLNRKGLADAAATPAIKDALSRGRAAVIYIDVNELKILNDSFGHRVGDAAIAVTAKRLQTAVRADDYVARMGGDEFICLIVDDDPIAAAEAIASRFRTKSERPFRASNHLIKAFASIGVAIAQPNMAWDDLVSQADEAMYQAKKSHSRDAVFFKPSSVAAE